MGAVFEGVGVSLGSLIGGIIYEKYGGWWAFRIFGLASLVCCVVHVIAQYLLNHTSKKGNNDVELNGTEETMMKL